MRDILDPPRHAATPPRAKSASTALDTMLRKAPRFILASAPSSSSVATRPCTAPSSACRKVASIWQASANAENWTMCCTSGRTWCFLQTCTKTWHMPDRTGKSALVMPTAKGEADTWPWERSGAKKSKKGLPITVCNAPSPGRAGGNCLHKPTKGCTTARRARVLRCGASGDAACASLSWLCASPPDMRRTASACMPVRAWPNAFGSCQPTTAHSARCTASADSPAEKTGPAQPAGGFEVPAPAAAAPPPTSDIWFFAAPPVLSLPFFLPPLFSMGCGSSADASMVGPVEGAAAGEVPPCKTREVTNST
mmetsp:Transcript_22971/g.66511  ORF Transcript_22971/g.66511 Transcript_22971/m.66511 type:complete len:309 (-) Transcript_22971:2841-3767(-)